MDCLRAVATKSNRFSRPHRGIELRPSPAAPRPLLAPASASRARIRFSRPHPLLAPVSASRTRIRFSRPPRLIQPRPSPAAPRPAAGAPPRRAPRRAARARRRRAQSRRRRRRAAAPPPCRPAGASAHGALPLQFTACETNQNIRPRLTACWRDGSVSPTRPASNELRLIARV